MSNMTGNHAAPVAYENFFSEAGGEWRKPPLWVESLIQLGYRWGGDLQGQRRVALVSMPCDSAACGLIALGALIRDLRNPKANEYDGYYDALLRYARQYLESCRDCDLAECKPDVKRCGYVAKVSGRLRSPKFSRKTFTISEKTDFNRRQIAWEYPHAPGHSKNVTQYPSPTHAMNWHIEGEPPSQISDGAGALPEEMYRQIVEAAQIVDENLRRSFSDLCLAGRVSGETATREACAAVRFRCSTGEYGLPDLLTVHGWSRFSVVSRMTFFNTRNEKFDRRALSPALVVADGDVSVLKVLGRSEFQTSDVIGVIHRTIERDRMEAVGTRMLGLHQWYAEDFEMVSRLPVMPRGINVSILKKRTS